MGEERDHEVRVLIVEDEADNCEVMRAVVEDLLGYKAILACDGVVALDKVRENPPDLILMDLMMPQLDGYEATSRLKADPKTRDIPIIIVSAYSNYSDRERILEGGANDYIAKPYSIEVLADTIQRFIPD